MYLYEVLESEDKIGIVMTQATGGELFSHVLKKKFLSEAEAGRIFSQIIDGTAKFNNGSCGIFAFEWNRSSRFEAGTTDRTNLKGKHFAG